MIAFRAHNWSNPAFALQEKNRPHTPASPQELVERQFEVCKAAARFNNASRKKINEQFGDGRTTAICDGGPRQAQLPHERLY
jgi:hypothetical protein